MGLDDVDNPVANFWGYIEADDEVLVEFGEISFFLPDMNVGSDINERLWRVADGFAKLFKLKDALINVVAVICRNVFVERLGTPIFCRNFDDKRVGKESDGGRWNSVGEEIGRGRRATRNEGRQGVSDWWIVHVIVENKIGVIKVVKRFGLAE